jgi:dTDP-4-dehydrorhamnose reductase
MAEEIVLDATGGRNTVLRLSLVYGWGRKGGRRGFIGWLQDSLIEGRPVTLFIDEMRSPVYLEDVVDVMNECIEQNISGLYHIGGWESINRYDFGLRFAETMGYNPSCLVQASIKDFSGMPPRPRDLTLNTHRAQDTFQTILGGVDDGLRRMRQRFDHPEGEPRPKKLRPPRIAEDNPESSGS